MASSDMIARKIGARIPHMTSTCAIRMNEMTAMCHAQSSESEVGRFSVEVVFGDDESLNII